MSGLVEMFRFCSLPPLSIESLDLAWYTTRRNNWIVFLFHKSALWLDTIPLDVDRLVPSQILFRKSNNREKRLKYLENGAWSDRPSNLHQAVSAILSQPNRYSGINRHRHSKINEWSTDANRNSYRRIA